MNKSEKDSTTEKIKSNAFLQKYWILTLIFILIPILLCASCYFSIPFFNTAGSSAWLSFWGGYLGSGIMVGVTLYVLDRQLFQNHKENLCNAVLQIATLTNNEEKTHIDKLADTAIELQSSFDFLTINQVAERMFKGQYLSSDVVLLNSLIREVDRLNFKVDILLKPIPQSKYIKEYNTICTNLYWGYGLLIGDFIFFIDLMKDLPKRKELIKPYILREIQSSRNVENESAPNLASIPNLKIPKRIFEIIEENNYYEDIKLNASKIISKRLLQSIGQDSQLKESLKFTIIDMVNYEYNCITENFNERIKVYE